MAKSLNSLPSRILGQIGNYLIPDHVKRIMFVVTVYHYMIGDLENQELDSLEGLSEALGLAKTSSSALIFPGMFTGKIWNQETVNRLLRVHAGNNDRRVFNLIPCWLHYGRANDIAKDIDALRDYVQLGKAA